MMIVPDLIHRNCRRILLHVLIALCIALSHVHAAPSDFVQARDDSLVVDEQLFQFKAICFSNSYILNQFDPQKLALHHSEIDFRRVRGMGFNAIRFGINGNWYQQDPDGFFSWLDTNIAWAEKYGIKLILDLHIPIDSFWLDPTSEKVSFAIWEQESVAQKNINFWATIAQRYHDNTTIAGYDILNEPVTTDKDGQQWQQLAGQMINAIRQYDRNHLIIVERLYGVEKNYGVKGARAQFLVDDDNVLYDFHFYEPIAYTHQGASWLAKPLGQGGKYPDENELTPTGLQRLNTQARISSSTLAEGDSDWQVYSSEAIELTRQQVVAGAPQMAIHGSVSGEIVFDDIEVIEIAPNGEQRSLLKESLTDVSLWQWYSWHKQSDNKFSFKQNTTHGFNDNHSLTVQTNQTPAETLGGWSSDRSWHKAKVGYRYQIIGRMKGKGVQYHNDKAYIGFELNFFEPAAENQPVYNTRDKDYLRREINKFSAFGKQHQVPVSVLETGVVSRAFGALGGANWYQDMLSLFEELNISYAFWNYHGDQMGMFRSSVKQPPADPNHELIELLITAQQGNREWAYSGLNPAPHTEHSIIPITTSTGTELSRPPNSLGAQQVPQFVMLGFDDNTKSAGIHWALGLLEDRQNPAGTGNPATYDGSPARVSFYMNTAGFNQWLVDDPKLLVAATRQIAAQGHEIANHTKTHHADINKLPWDEFQERVKKLSEHDWYERMVSMETDLKRDVGEVALTGFRAPYLAYNQAMMDNLVKLGYRYDTSVEEGYGKQFDGTNFRWPYRMDNGIPGHIEGWWGSPNNKDAVKMSTAKGVWQFPNYVLIVPEDKFAQQYDFEAGLWARIKKQAPHLVDHKITGFDYNLWVNTKLSGRDVLAILKYSLDLRLAGNRAPFLFGVHSQYYVDEAWAAQHTGNVTIAEMQGAISAFIDYALSKPEVRMRPANDVLDWIENPVPLGE